MLLSRLNLRALLSHCSARAATHKGRVAAREAEQAASKAQKERDSTRSSRAELARVTCAQLAAASALACNRERASR